MVKFPTARVPERARQSIPITKEEKDGAEDDNILSLRASSKLPDINGVSADQYDDLIDGNAPIKSSTRGSSNTMHNKATVDASRQRKETLMKIGGDELSSVNMIDEDEPIGSK